MKIVWNTTYGFFDNENELSENILNKWDTLANRFYQTRYQVNQTFQQPIVTPTTITRTIFIKDRQTCRELLFQLT